MIKSYGEREKEVEGGGGRGDLLEFNFTTCQRQKHLHQRQVISLEDFTFVVKG